METKLLKDKHSKILSKWLPQNPNFPFNIEHDSWFSSVNSAIFFQN